MALQAVERKELAPVAQLDRASVFGTEGWGFESLRAYYNANSLDTRRNSLIGND